MLSYEERTMDRKLNTHVTYTKALAKEKKIAILTEIEIVRRKIRKEYRFLRAAKDIQSDKYAKAQLAELEVRKAELKDELATLNRTCHVTLTEEELAPIRELRSEMKAERIERALRKIEDHAIAQKNKSAAWLNTVVDTKRSH